MEGCAGHDRKQTAPHRTTDDLSNLISSLYGKQTVSRTRVVELAQTIIRRAKTKEQGRSSGNSRVATEVQDNGSKSLVGSGMP